jgi:glyoxylase-like metal-dependent hydrolase (beta-lactamase superfamily II)
MRRIAPDLWLVDGILSGFFPYALNVYLAGDVLVDGATRLGRGRMLSQLRGRRVNLVALTHCHPDHQGIVKAACERFHAPLACHEADAPAMEGSEPFAPASRIMTLGRWTIAGPPHPVARRLRDGDHLGPWRVIHAPGHTPGHIFFFRESDRVTIAGDVLRNVNFITGREELGEPPRIFSTDPEENRRSIQRLIDLRPSLVCFGHGPPLRDVDRITRYLKRRLERRASRPSA